MIFSPLPVGTYRLVQSFGNKLLDKNGKEVYKQFGLIAHNGYDLAPLVPGTKGVVVYAPHDGYVTLGAEKGGYGNYVSLIGLPHDRDGNQHRSDLAHLDSYLVKYDQFVHQGDPVGIMGKTGFADGIHLHWTYKVMRNDMTQDVNNGYRGAIPVGKYARLWVPKTLVP